MFKLIQIGIGGMGNAWIKAVNRSRQIGFAALVEIDPQVVAEQMKRYNFDPKLIFGSLGEALQSVEADGILNVTPPAFHEEISFTALEAGIPILAEKPLALSMDSARRIEQKAEESSVLYLVTQDYRYSRHIQTVKKLLDSGMLGPLGSISIDYAKGPRLEGFHQQLPYPLLMDMSIHHFDLLRFFLEREPESIQARAWNPSWSWFKGKASTVAQFDFSGGIVVSYRGTWVATGLETTWTGDWHFDCRDGVILMRDDKVFILRAPEGRAPGGVMPPFRRGPLEKVPLVKMKRERQSYLLEEFRQAVGDGTRPPTVIQDNIKSLAMVFGAIASSDQGKSIVWEQAIEH